MSFLIKFKYFAIYLCVIFLSISCNEQYSEVREDHSRSSSGPGTQKGSSYSAMQMKWNQNNISSTGLNIYVSEDLLTEFEAKDYVDDLNPVQLMLNEWNSSSDDIKFFNIQSASDDLAISSDQKRELLNYNDNVLGIYKHDDWFDDISPSALAITQFFGKRINPGSNDEYLELIHADIIVNYKYFSFGIEDDMFENYDLSSVILHELGHFLGLTHSGYEEDSIMVPYLDVGVKKRNLKQYDLNSVSNLYQVRENSSNSNLSLMASSVKASQSVSAIHQKKQIVQGIIELQASGDCRHYINGELVHQHKKMPSHFKLGMMN